MLLIITSQILKIFYCTECMQSYLLHGQDGKLLMEYIYNNNIYRNLPVKLLENEQVFSKDVEVTL